MRVHSCPRLCPSRRTIRAPWRVSTQRGVPAALSSRHASRLSDRTLISPAVHSGRTSAHVFFFLLFCRAPSTLKRIPEHIFYTPSLFFMLLERLFINYFIAAAQRQKNISWSGNNYCDRGCWRHSTDRRVERTDTWLWNFRSRTRHKLECTK